MNALRNTTRTDGKRLYYLRYEQGEGDREMRGRAACRLESRRYGRLDSLRYERGPRGHSMIISHAWWCIAGLLCWLAFAGVLFAQTPPPDYSFAMRQYEQAVREEMAAWHITGISVAWVDDQRIVYAAGFGEAKRDSVFRAGSISKLFNAIAVMQLVETGKLDLDTPLEQYARELVPVSPFTNAPPVTLRQLLCHRSGMIREAPAGGYFDKSGPDLIHTVASVGQCVLVNPPNTKTRYSNVGPSLAGRVVELVSGASYEQYQREHIQGPLGMTSSVWHFKEVPSGKLAPAYMRVADGRGGFKREPAPKFDLGTLPAGNLFTTAEDLARFLMMLGADGATQSGRILKAESLAQMFTPQLTMEPTGFGLGFMVGKFRDHKMVSHSGAVYGYSTSLMFLPGPKVGAIVLGNEDIANGRISRLANLALSLLMETKFGEKPPAPPAPVQITVTELAAFAGDYESQSFWARLEVKEGQLVGTLSGQPTRFTAIGPRRYLANNRLEYDAPVSFERNATGMITGFTMGAQKYTRVPTARPSLPTSWANYFGSYGPSFIPLVVSARNGHMYAMTENLADYRLTPVNRNVFAFPPGLYADEYLVFLSNPDRRSREVSLANMVLKRH